MGEIKEDEDLPSVMEKAKTAIKEQLKAEGIDFEDPEAMQAKLMAEMRKITDAKPDESDEEVKLKVAKHLLQELKDQGMDVDPEKPDEAVDTIKAHLKNVLKEMNIDVGEDIDLSNIGELMQKVIMSGKLGHPLHMMMSAMATFSSGAQQHGQPMMMPVPVQQGAEDALIHVFGGEDEVIQHLMAVREGAMRGAISESALFELMKDLMHFRLEARVLLAQNRMLEERLEASHFHAMPPFARSPYALRVMGCRHMH